MMNKLQITKWEIGKAGEYGRFTMTIDGIDIVSMLRKYERPFAEAEGHPNLAGSYAVYCIDDQEAALLIPEEGQSANADLLECDCASPGCWPLQATVERNNGTMRWNRFEQVHRVGKWNHDGFGPFEFDAKAYADEIKRLLRR